MTVNQGQNLALTVLYVPYSLGSGGGLQNTCSAEMRSGFEEGSYSRLIACCISQR